MKEIFALALVLLAVNTFGQNKDSKATGVTVTGPEKNGIDTGLKIFYVDRKSGHEQLTYFLNGHLINNSLLTTIDPDTIESINVTNTNQILIKTKNGYAPQMLSLTDLKKKYTRLKDSIAVFMINDAVINEDYDKYIVDKNYLLRMDVQKLEYPAGANLSLIKLWTRSKENIKAANTIRIRGELSRVTNEPATGTSIPGNGVR